MCRRAIISVALLCGAAVSASPASAQEMVAPMDLQIATMEKILEFDRKYHERVGDEIVVAILYQSRFRSSANALRDFQREIGARKLEEVRDLPLRVLPVEYSSVANLGRVIDEEEVDFLYLTPLRSVSLTSIIDISRASDTPTLTGVPDYVEEGVAVGVTVQGQRLRILVNLAGAREEGMDLSSELLKLATVLDGER